MDCLICSCTYVAWFELGTYLEHFFFFNVSILLLWFFGLGGLVGFQAFFSCWAGGGGGPAGHEPQDQTQNLSKMGISIC
ncbi:hypothetical protein PVL29_008291 [Vitis rotundifolia]|uniref:Uncharacterized protein n=1 Tax=Vitis rotundifolia TaxID=103349 RepID=A0AA38ZX37_VITRO|nr:hypothetical protein PVL29_008291 [Vitis rotundifolia]